MEIHTNTEIKKCNYLSNGNPCHFEKIGCKLNGAYQRYTFRMYDVLKDE